ncbi:MAG: response regulator transcription factor [Planctomycetes bacterium]|nr:response regulator transcription factor [Planctomycetota bacterium]
MAPRGSSARNERQSPDAHGLRISRAGPLAPDASRADAAAEPKIRVLLADDHVVMRQGLSHLLRNEPDIEVIAEASDGKTAVDLVRQFKPDVVLMDISMPEMDGVEATRIVHAEHPAVRIVGLSMFQEGQAAARMKAAGAAAYLTKSGPSDELLAAIRACREPADDATDSRIGGHQP